jgi:hypothetical protein
LVGCDSLNREKGETDQEGKRFQMSKALPLGELAIFICRFIEALLRFLSVEFVLARTGKAQTQVDHRVANRIPSIPRTWLASRWLRKLPVYGSMDPIGCLWALATN